MAPLSPFPPACFPQLLSPASSLTSTPRLKGELLHSHQSYSADLVLIDRCKFISVKNREGSGGAVTSTGSLEFFNCYFALCESSVGGAISSASMVTLDFVTISHCKAKDSGALNVRSQSSAECELRYTLFEGNQANLFGSVYRLTNGEFLVSATNVSGSRAHCVASIESKCGSLVFRFSIMADSSAESHNGGMVLRNLDQFTIEHNLFLRCDHRSNEKEAGAVLLIYDNPYDSSLSNCAFVQNGYNGSHTVTVAFGHGLMLSECCFSGPKEAELNLKNVAAEKCVFDQAECPTVRETVKRGMGFNELLSEVPSVRRPKPTMTGITQVVRRRPSSELFGLSLMISGVIATVLTVMQTLYRKSCKGHRKVPRAIL